MRIQGAVLERVGVERPYELSQPISVGALNLDGPGPGELLVRIEAAGICHSDLSVVDGVRERPVPMLLGHEAAGIVEEVGDGVRDIVPGRRIVTTFLPRCGDCTACAGDRGQPCLLGTAANVAGTLLAGASRLSRDGMRIRHHLGVSAFASHAVVHRASVVAVPADIPADVAALLGCAILTGGGAILNVARPEAGDTVAVVGLGGVGMAAVLTALAHDDVDVVGIDVSPEKLDAARRLGVRACWSPAEAVERGVQATQAIEAAGSVEAFEAAVAVTAAGGTTIAVGLPHADATARVSPTSLVAEGRSIRGSYMGSAVPAREIPVFIGLWRRGRLPVEQLISDTIELDGINRGMDQIADGSAVRQLIRMGDIFPRARPT